MAITVPATGDQISATNFGKPVADQLNAAPLGLIHAQTASNVSVATTTQTTIRTATVAMVSGRNYLLRTQSWGTYITGGAAGQSFRLGMNVNGTNMADTLVVDSNFSGGYLVQNGYWFRYKSTVTGNIVVNLYVMRNAGATGTMQACYDLQIVDEGANV